MNPEYKKYPIISGAKQIYKNNSLSGIGWLKYPITIILMLVLYNLNAQWTNIYPEIPLRSFAYEDPRFEIFEIDNKTLVVSQNSGFLIDKNGRLKFAKSLNNNSPFNNHSYISHKNSLYQGIKFSTGLRIRKYNSNFDVVDSMLIRSPNIVSGDFGVVGNLLFVVLYEKFKSNSSNKDLLLAGYDFNGNLVYRKVLNTSLDPEKMGIEIKEVNKGSLALQLIEKGHVWTRVLSLQLVDFTHDSEYYPDYVNYRSFNEPLYNGGFVFVNDTAYLTSQSRYSTGITIVDTSGHHVGTHIFSHIGDIWTDHISYNDGKIGTLSTSNSYIVFRCLDKSGNIINEEFIDHECNALIHPNFGHYSSFTKNNIGGFTFGYSVIEFEDDPYDGKFYPHIFKTDSTCQIQELQTLDPVLVHRKITHRDVSIYPNPSHGIFNVSGNFEMVSVYDSIGRLVKKSTDRTIDLGRHPDGMYFFRIGESTFKVIKQ